MSVTDDELLLLSQFVHSGYFAPSVRFEEPTLRGLDLTDRCVPALLAVLQVGLFPGLAVLDLTDCQLGDTSVCELCECLRLHPAPLDLLLCGECLHPF